MPVFYKFRLISNPTCNAYSFTMSKKRELSQITELIIHCAATPNGVDFTAEDIDQWHEERGFNRAPCFISKDAPLTAIGYHYVIDLKGAVTIGRLLTETGAHALHHNTSGIGICLVGTDRFTSAQWQRLAKVVTALQRQFPAIEIKGHRDLSPDLNGNGVIEKNEWLKTCPGFDVQSWLDNKQSPSKFSVLESDHD